MRSECRILVLVLLAAWAAGCLPKTGSSGRGDDPEQMQGTGRIQAVRFIDPVRAVLANPPITARGAKNETINFALQISGPGEGASGAVLKLSPLVVNGGTIPVSSFQAYQVLPMPVQTNRAAFVRYTGLPAIGQSMPRALVPMAISPEGEIDLGQLRDAEHATDPHSRAQGAQATAIVWIDVQVPATAAAGTYQGTCELIEGRRTAAAAPVSVQVDDFVIPDERHLLMVGAVRWNDLTRLWGEEFGDLRPNLLSRKDPRYARAVERLDELVKLAEAHRCQAVVPELQPSVFWPAAKPPRVDWSDFDSVLTPWMDGSAFADQVPMGYWPMPYTPRLELHPTSDRMAYWAEVASHFVQAGWDTRSSSEIARQEQGRASLDEAVEISADAAARLAANPRIRVSVPLEEEQVMLANPMQINWIPAQSLDRLLYAGAGLVSAPPINRLPAGAGTRWLRTDLPGLVPGVGAGADEREVRMWAWLAMVRDARLIRWTSVLPAEAGPDVPAEPDELVWFYPGEWFGLDKPVPTIQLKWLRRAEQDFEYLWIAKQRGQGERATVLARLITKPVDLQGAQAPDPVYGLMSGASDPEAWDRVLELLARVIDMGRPGQPIDRNADQRLGFAISNWTMAQQKPLLMARSLNWSSPLGTHNVDLKVGFDVYNVASQTPDANRVEWSTLPPAWSASMEPAKVGHLGPFSVTRASLWAHVNLDELKYGVQKPARLTFVDGLSLVPYSLDVMAPVAYSEKRGPGGPPRLDGNLVDWGREDALYDGPLVMMLSRPSFQRQSLQFAQRPSALYSTWTPGSFYLAFKVEGADAAIPNAGRSWIDYEFRRAWGEDVCELLIQPLYADGTSGPLFYAGCKKLPQIDVERRLDPRRTAEPWQAFNGSGVLYASSIDAGVWRGEVVIPWSAINAPGEQRLPRFLRFNFVQHRGSSGESSSWAGPIDFSRDEQMMGLIEIRQPARRGFVPQH